MSVAQNIFPFTENTSVLSSKGIDSSAPFNDKQKILNFSLLSHFYAYVMEGLLDMGETELIKEAMHNIEKFRNKKGGMIPVLILAFCFTGTAVLLFSRTIQPQGVCIVSGNTASVRRIPEAAGSVVYQLTLGETVVIVRKTAIWYYVKTAGGITGWIPQNTLAICGNTL